MGRLRFVAPEAERYDLSDGDWIRVKKFLNAGEQKDLEGAGVPQMSRDEEQQAKFDLDYKRLGLGRLVAYLVEWSFDDAKGKRTEPTFETIAALDVDTVKEIDAVLDKHIPAMEKEKNARKPASAGAAS